MVVYISAYNGFEVVRRLGSEPGMVRWDHGSDPGGSRAAQITATKLGILPNVTLQFKVEGFRSRSPGELKGRSSHTKISVIFNADIKNLENPGQRAKPDKSASF